MTELIPSLETTPDLFAQAVPPLDDGYRVVFERNPTPMWVFDLDSHRFLAVNAAAVAEYGYPPEKFLTLTMRDVYAEADLVRFDGLARDAQELYTGDWVHRRHDGTLLHVEIRSNDLLFQDRRARLIHVTNVTGRFEAASQRKVMEDQLRQALKMEAIGRLAGGVAHDFNNMLTVILGYSELLTEQVGPDKPIGRDLREIQTAAERAGALTKQLLAFSRKQVFSLVAVDITQVVRTVEPMLQRLLGERITIATDLAEDLALVMADVAQLETLLINLSVNARDAMPEGGVLTFTTAYVTLDATFAQAHPGAIVGSYAMVRVTDSGIGMASDVRSRIFEPFFTTKDVGRGTGLGLAAAYGTVKQLGGYIDVESQLGRGTTFSVYLPASTHTAQILPVAPAVTTHVGHETILLVEDESGVRSFVKMALERFGYRVIEADSAEAALSLLKGDAAPVHLLLTDLVLPGMDGAQLATHVTRERPDARVLLMSGYGPTAGSHDSGLDPSIQLLEKPFTSDALLTKTRQVLGVQSERDRT